MSSYWQASTDGFATFNNILSNTENYQHPTGITTTTQFRRVDVSELNGQTCSDTTVPVTVSVNAPPVGNLLVNGAAQASLTICTGDTPIFTITGGVASNSYIPLELMEACKHIQIHHHSTLLHLDLFSLLV